MTDYAARYDPAAGPRFSVRAWIVVAVLALALVSVIVLSVANGNLVLGLVGGFFVAVALLWGITAARRSRRRWTADDRLAIGFSDSGVTLPTVGLLAWDRVLGFRIVDAGRPIMRDLGRLQNINGTSDRQEIQVIQVIVRGNETTYFRKLGGYGRQHLRGSEGPGTVLLATAWGQGLRDPSFAQVAAVVEQEAARRSLPVTR